MSGLAQLRAAARLLARGYAARRASADSSAGPRRRQAVERTGLRPSPAELRRYLLATAGEPLQPSVEGGALPPLYGCTWETQIALDLLSRLEPPLPLGAVVHAGSDLLIARPPSLRDALRCRVELERTEPSPGGVRVQVTARNWASAGRLMTEATHRFVVRHAGGGERPPPEPLDLSGWERAHEWRLPADAGLRYARASGDWNPIHLWGWTARPLGFKRPILHGFCTAAMVAHALCHRLWGDDAAALRRFRIHFRAPLPLPGGAVLWLRGPAFRVTDPAGTRLFAEGDAGGGQPA